MLGSDVVGQILSEIEASARRLSQAVTAEGWSRAIAEGLRSIEEQAIRAATHIRQAETTG